MTEKNHLSSGALPRPSGGAGGGAVVKGLVDKIKQKITYPPVPAQRVAPDAPGVFLQALTVHTWRVFGYLLLLISFSFGALFSSYVHNTPVFEGIFLFLGVNTMVPHGLGSFAPHGIYEQCFNFILYMTVMSIYVSSVDSLVGDYKHQISNVKLPLNSIKFFVCMLHIQFIACWGFYLMIEYLFGISGHLIGFMERSLSYVLALPQDMLVVINSLHAPNSEYLGLSYFSSVYYHLAFFTVISLSSFYGMRGGSDRDDEKQLACYKQVCISAFVVFYFAPMLINSFFWLILAMVK